MARNRQMTICSLWLSLRSGLLDCLLCDAPPGSSSHSGFSHDSSEGPLKPGAEDRHEHGRPLGGARATVRERDAAAQELKRAIEHMSSPQR